MRQRKSLNVLGEFGEVTYTDSDGQIKTRNGEYSQGIGKIDILKDRKDLSKINREKLIDFFIFTKGDSIDATAPAFWMNIFNKGEVLGKDEKGVEIKYTLTKPIDSKDLDDNFK